MRAIKLLSCIALLLASQSIFAAQWCQDGTKVTVMTGTITMADIASIPAGIGNNNDRAYTYAETFRDAYLASHPGANVSVTVSAQMVQHPLDPTCWYPSPYGPWTYRVIRCYPPGVLPALPVKYELDFARDIINENTNGTGVTATNDSYQVYTDDRGKKVVLYNVDLIDAQGIIQGTMSMDLSSGDVETSWKVPRK